MNRRVDALRAGPATKVDPVTFQIINGALIAATRAMAAILRRSARSTIIRETQDFSTAVFDATGRLAAQSEAIPLHLNSLGYSLSFCLKDYPADTLEADDILIVNDPYYGGQHLPDIQVFSPIVFRGTVVGFVGNLAHHTDLSGGIGSMNPTATDVFQEGMRIPPLKIKPARDLDAAPGRLLMANSRQPDTLRADLDAQIASNRTGQARVLELIEKYGLDNLMASIAMAQDFSELEMRKAIREVPNGVYTGEDFLDGDGFDTQPLCIRVTVRVSDEEIEIDYTGTDPQARGYVNSPLASTVSAAGTAVRALLGHPDMITNDGTFRPVRVHVPHGCLLNPRYPAPVRLRMNSAGRAYGAVLQALGKAVPARAAACGFDTTTTVNFGYFGERGYTIFMEPMRGGMGGASGMDGADAISQLLSNSANTPVEVAESDNAFLITREYSLRPDSGGAGEFQGGLGGVREYEITVERVEALFSSDRAIHRPWGSTGGDEGTIGRVVVIRKNGEAKQLPPNGAALTLHRGDRLRVETGGGGGFGDPARRSPEAVRRDLAAGRITKEFAQQWYGSGAAKAP
jgi:N-methylhydantoinase B